MLGGFVMLSTDAQPIDDTAPQALLRARQLLEEALALIDAHADAPALGARLQEVIDGLKSETD